MPELPEVETVKNDLAREITGRKIMRCAVFDGRVLKVSPAVFVRALKGKIFGQPARRAKAIIIPLEPDGDLVVQLGMTGRFFYRKLPLSGADSRDVKVVFELDNGCRLYYLDQRMFGWLIHARDLAEVPYLSGAGPEPLGDEFTVGYLAAALKSRKGPVKNLLLNQGLVAGLGNIYACESLFAAGINPTRPAGSLSAPDLEKLHRNIRRILRKAIARRGTTLRDYRDASGKKGGFLEEIKVYGKAGRPCPGCGAGIVRITQAGRSTFFCPACQKDPEIH
jgi:formamidopyrimidine-DNA glycosylase